MFKEEDLLKYCRCKDCKEKVKKFFEEYGKMESNLIVYELEVSKLLKQCPTCIFEGTDKLL